MKIGDILKVNSRSRQGGLYTSRGPQYSSDATTNGQSESLYESHNRGSLTQRSGFPDISVNKHKDKPLPVKQINKWVRGSGAKLKQELPKEEHDGSEESCQVETKINAISKIYQPKTGNKLPKNRVCHCYACEYKRMMQQLKEGNLPSVHHPFEKRKSTRPDISKSKILTFTEAPVIANTLKNETHLSQANNLPLASAPPEEMEAPTIISPAPKASVFEKMAKIKPFVNEDKKESNYRKRLRFKLTKKKIWVQKQNKKYKPYQLEIRKIKQNTQLRRCSSQGTIVQQRYFSKEVPNIILIDLFAPKIVEPPPTLEEPKPEPVIEAPEEKKEDVEVSISIEKKKKKDIASKRRKSFRSNNIKKRIDDAKLETLLFYEPDPLIIDTKYYSVPKKREILKQIKNVFRYEPQKAFSLEASVLNSENSLDNTVPEILLIKNYCIELRKNEEIIMESLLLGKYIILILKHLLIEERRIMKIKTLHNFVETDNTDLEAYYEFNNDDRMQSISMGLAFMKEEHKGKKKINRKNWYVGIADQQELNDDEIFVERDTQFLLQYQGVEYRGKELVKPEKEIVVHNSRKRYSLNNIFEKIDLNYLKEKPDEIEVSSDSDSDDGKVAPVEPGFSWKRRGTINIQEYPIILPNSPLFKKKVLEILQGSASEHKEREVDSQFIIKSATSVRRFSYKAKLKILDTSFDKLNIREVRKHLTSRKLELVMYNRNGKEKSSRLFEKVVKDYNKPYHGIDNFNVDDEMLFFYQRSEIEPLETEVDVCLKCPNMFCKIENNLKKIMEFEYLKSYNTFIHSELYNEELFHLIHIKNNYQSMKELINENAFQPSNMEFIILHERISYPFSFEQLFTRTSSSLTGLNDLKDSEEVEEPNPIRINDLHSTYYRDRFQALIREVGSTHHHNSKQREKKGVVRLAHIFRDRSVSYSIESENVEDPDPLQTSTKRSSSKLQMSILLPKTFHLPKHSRGISRPVIKIKEDLPPHIDLTKINSKAKESDKKQLCPNLSPIKRGTPRSPKRRFKLTDDSLIFSPRSSGKDSNKSFVESEDEAFFKESSENQKGNLAPTASQESEFTEKERFEKKFYTDIVRKVRDYGKQIQNKTRNTMKRESLKTLKIYSSSQLKRTATVKFLGISKMEEKAPVVPAVQIEPATQKKRIRFLISKKKPEKVILPPETLLHQAINRNQVKEVEGILSKYSGIRLNRHSSDGLSLLHEAVRTGTVALVELLLKAGADIDSQDRQGNTAAHYAKSYEYNTILDMLLSYGANEGILNYQGMTIWEGASFPSKLTLIHS